MSMMMDPFDAFKLYQSMKLHFDSDSYDAIKYNFKTAVKPQSFFKRKDKYHFAKLGNKYPTADRLVEFLLANFVKGTKWVGDMVGDEDNLTSWRKTTESLKYNFSTEVSTLALHHELDDLLRTKGGNLPKIITMLINEEIHITTVVIVDQLTNFMDNANHKISETMLWPDIYKLVKKVSPFIRVNQSTYRKIVVESFS